MIAQIGPLSTTISSGIFQHFQLVNFNKTSNKYRMRLMELIGIRQDPLIKGAKGIFAKPHMKSQHQRDVAFEKFDDLMLKHGFRNIGSGDFSGIYEKPGYPWVFKIFAHDPAYLRFVQWARKHQDNDNLPRFKGAPMLIAPDTYVVRMENLKRIPVGQQTELIRVLGMIDNAENPPEQAKWLDMLGKRWPGIYQIVDVILHGWKDLHPDLHRGNIMMRGQTPVIIDPVVG